MSIEIDVDFLLKEEMSPNTYVFLKLWSENKYSTIKELLDPDELPTAIIQAINLGFILSDFSDSIEKELSEIVMSKHHVQRLFKVDGSPFWELFSTYPIKVYDKRGGARKLRPTGMDAKETKECKKKYESIIKGSKSKHDYIIRCLNAELDSRRDGGNISYMQGLKVWLNQHGWEKYEDELEPIVAEDVEQTKEGGKYGEALI